MPFLMVRGDIAKMQTDAVVIPAAGAGQPQTVQRKGGGCIRPAL